MPSSIVVDCGPLLTYLALLYLDRESAPEAKRALFFGDLRQGAAFGESEQECLQVRLKTVRILTTPHVLAEIFKLRRSSPLGRERAFQPFCLEFLRADKITEVPCGIDELTKDQDFRLLICRLGLTDAGLVFVAAREKALLLTDDRSLSDDYSAGAGYQSKLLEDWLRE